MRERDSRSPQHKSDVVWAPLLEGALILTAGLLGLVIRQPLIFTSLGPTVYEQVETPERRSATPYSILVGHMVALGAGFVSLFILHALHTAKVAASGHLNWPRIWASVLAAMLTVLVTLLLKASQPAALSTTLLVTLGSYDTAWKAMAIMVGVVTVTVLGQPLRRIRKRQRSDASP